MKLLDTMRLFNRVAALGNISAAARELGVSPTTASRQIAELEADLGVRLMNRTTRRLSLTELGERYHARSSQILYEIDALQDTTRGAGASPGGRIRATLASLFAHAWLAPNLPRFLDRYPDISLDLDVSDRIVDLVGEGFDIAIRMGRLADSGLMARHLGNLRTVICAAPDYLARAGTPATIGDLAAHACVLWSNPRSTSVWKYHLGGEEGAYAVPSRVKVNSAGAAVVAVLGGVGIGLLPATLVDPHITDGRLIPLLERYELEAYPVYAVWPHRQHMSAKTRVFVDFLAAKFPS